MDVAQPVPQEAHYHVGVINWELIREHGVYGTLGKAYTNSVADQHSLYPVGRHNFTPYVCSPWGWCVSLRYHRLQGALIPICRPSSFMKTCSLFVICIG